MLRLPAFRFLAIVCASLLGRFWIQQLQKLGVPDLRDGLEASLPIPSLEVRVSSHLPVFVEADKFGCSVVPLLREPHLVPAEQVGTHQGGVMGGEDQKKAPIWTNVQIGA